MAKYRITSIPQSLPKNQFGGLFKKKKKTTAPSWTPQSIPVENLSSPISNAYSFSLMDQKCAPGLVYYNGQCILESDAIKIQKQEAYEQERSDTKKVVDLYEKIQNEKQRVFDDKLSQDEKFYRENFYKSKKSDKIEPAQTYPKENLESDFEYQDPNNPDGPPIKVKLKDYLSQSYVIIENKKDNSTGKAGTYSLWPKDVVLDRIYNNGFQPEQFKNIWKFDDDQVKQIKDQLNPYFENAKDIYNKNMSEEVLKQMGETGKTPEEIISGFSKKVGKPKYLAKPIQDFVNTTIENYTKAIQDETNKSEIEDYKGFDFLHATRQVWVDKETGKETKKGAKNAVLIGETFDPEKYYDYWVNQGKTEKEKAERRKKINDIKNKNYVDPLEGTVGDLYKEIPFNSELEKQRNISGSDQMSNLRSGLRTELSNINLAKRAVATENEIKQKKENELDELTGFGNEMSKFLTSYHPQQYKEALNKIYDSKHLSQEDKNKLYSLLTNKNTEGVNELLMDKPLSEDKTYGDLLNDLLSGETFAEDFERSQKRGTFSQGIPQEELSFGEKFWDAVTNPDEAINALGRSGYGHGSFSQNMWGSDRPTMTSNAWQNIAKTDLNVAKGLKEKNFNRGTDFTASGILNRFNPLKVIDNATFGYQNDGITGVRDSLLDDAQRAVEVAAFITPAGALGAAEAFAGASKGLGTAYEAFKTAQGLNKLRAAGNLAMPALGYGITGINNIVSKVPIVGKPVVRYVDNAMHYGLYPWLAEGLTKELPELVENVGEGEYGDALGNAANLALQGQFLKAKLANTPEFFKYTTPSGRSISVGNKNLIRQPYTAQNEEELKTLTNAAVNSQIRNLYSTEAEAQLAAEQLRNREILPQFEDLGLSQRMQSQLNNQRYRLGDERFYRQNIGFNLGAPSTTPASMENPYQGLEMGLIQPPLTYPTKFGQFQFGTQKFRPLKLRGFDLRQPVFESQGPINQEPINSLGFEKGGDVSKKCPPKCTPAELRLLEEMRQLGKIPKIEMPKIEMRKIPGKPFVNLDNIKITLPEFEYQLNQNLKEGFGIKQTDAPLRMFLPKDEQGRRTGLKFNTYLGSANNNIGFIELDRLVGSENPDDFDYIPGMEGKTFFQKEGDFPFQYKPQEFYKYRGKGISGEFNKGITKTLQDFKLPPLYSSLMHTPEGFARWLNLTNKGAASIVNVAPSPVPGIGFERFVLHKKGGYVSTKLTQKEINKYVEGGYIVEEE